MVNQGADVPGVTNDSDSGSQGITDLTPEGQDSAVTTDTLVDTAQAAENTASVAGTEGTPGAVTEQAPAPEQPQTESSEQVDTQSFTELRDQVRSQQEQLQYYNQMAQRAQLQQQVDEYQKDLQVQGYMPEQAAQLAKQQADMLQQKQQLDKQAEDYRMFREGQRNAAMHYAKQYKLSFDDLAGLERFNTPQEMELEAKRVSENRELKVELARLKQQQVPAQSFDNNQPSPAATGSENELLDKYIAGDRSSDVVAAAQRLMG
jgi:hypothetical protein